MSESRTYSLPLFARDLTAGTVVFFVALPLCLGIALASTAAPISGLLSGIVGGLVVGLLSGSHTSVSGPAAGLTAVVAAQIAHLGSFEAFLLAVLIAGLIQIAMGIARAGVLSAFFPSSVIKGLLAAIGVILILKQIPHVLGHDTDPEGEMSFFQPDERSTLTEFVAMIYDLHLGAAVIGLLSLTLLVIWERVPKLKKSFVPAPLIVVLMGVAISQLFRTWGGRWLIEASHLVEVPIAQSLSEFTGFLRTPDFSQLTNPAIYVAGVTVAIVASLETLLNLEAVDKLDRKQRASPPSRELVAQGVGNVLCGLIGGLPVTSVIVRSSVNINSGGQTKLAAIIHGAFLLVSVMFFSQHLNLIPLSCLAAILLVTGFKLASPTIIRQMWSEGRYQFLPFILTVVSIVLTDLLVGILIGLGISVTFILISNLKQPLRRTVEKHLGGEVLHIELANQVSFLNRAALDQVFNEIPRGGHVLLDARSTVYIDPDILSMIREFKEKTAPVRGVQVSLRGFRDRYNIRDEIQYVDYSTRELQGKLSAAQVRQILQEGNERFRTGQRLPRDLGRMVQATAHGQHPLAVILSCIDSRSPAEIVFDLGLGDIFSVRVAGNVISPKVLGSMEYGCAVAGAKLIVVLGHTHCGAVTAAVNLAATRVDVEQATGCQHLQTIVGEIQQSIEPSDMERHREESPQRHAQFVDEVARRNVRLMVRKIQSESHTISRLVRDGRIEVVGAIYDVGDGRVEFFTNETAELNSTSAAT